MLDFFAIFTKGGIVLWCFRSTNQLFALPVNALIKNGILQERTGSNTYDHNNLKLQYKLDNEFELVFVVAFQKILQLTYVDKFLSDVHLEFRDKYKNELTDPDRNGMDFDFSPEYVQILERAEEWGRSQEKLPKQMRSYEESLKSKKTVASMIQRKGDEKESSGKSVKIDVKEQVPIEPVEKQEDLILVNRKKFIEKMIPKKKGSEPKKIARSPNEKEKVGKKPRVWDFNENAKSVPDLDRSKDKPGDVPAKLPVSTEMIGTMKGGIQDLAVESDEDYSEEESDDESETVNSNTKAAPVKKQTGMFSLFKGLVGSKNLTRADMQPALDKLRDHLIGKNVATDISQKLCESVATKLEGKVLGTFESIATTVKATLTDSLVQILSPKRRVDILRDCLEAKKEGRPYVMSFCGVNGVGKSTNLAKICFWLIENNFNVLIAACDTFRAGAVEQLRTHTRHLNALHPAENHDGRNMVQLYERGYGKDAAGIAMEAIRFAKDSKFDVVLVDTAGRMQDNEPLMRALAKLIQVNQPDLVLFVGEALVGNEAVDQLVKFNQSLADYSSSTNPHMIDGIVLTKFDTIDDKVGAAISMTYITGQPIVFVGTGQTYTDLKALNAKAVVHALMK
uniref:Putative signal recognition particle receptor alpha subunit n=1 Tax=Tabanus bromius TaxID=304241 RepID=A0A0K8TMF5_TABBR